MSKKKFKPIEPKASDVSSYRQKLNLLVKRMQKDYERELKPLIKKMSKRQREQVSEASKEALSVAKDAKRFFTAYETARMLSTIKSRVIRDIQAGKVQGAIREGEDWLIPEDSLESYAKAIGKELPEDELMAKFNKRLQRLRNKYEDLMYAYQNLAEKEIEKQYKQARKEFKKQFSKATGIDITAAMSDRGLKENYEARIQSNVELISSLSSDYFDDIQKMVSQSVTGEKKFEGGIVKALQDLTGASKKRAKFIARDQTQKAVSTFSHMRMQNVGVIGYQWKHSKDKRVAGNPSGLYPNVNDKSKYHGNHWARENKYYLFERWTGSKKNIPIAPDGKPFRQPPPDGAPGIPVNCRCYADPVIPDLD